MENKPSIPFERNRYYVGKLLTSLDFQAEQAYLNGKRHFINEMLFGEGVVCGLGVYNLDDTTVMVESGAALDGLGRELVLEKPLVRKLSAIEGFEQSKSERISLCLRYTEEPVRPVYAVNRQNQEEAYELNHIREGVHLFLTDVDQLTMGEKSESEFLNHLPLYSDSDYSAELALPACTPCDARVKLTLLVEKLSDTPTPFSVTCVLQLPAFTAEDGSHEVTLTAECEAEAKGSQTVREIWLAAQKSPSADSVLIVSAQGTAFRVGERTASMPENRMMKAAVEALSADEIITREIGKISLESHETTEKQDYIRLADFILQRSQTVCIIESVVETGVKKYVASAVGKALRRTYSSYYKPRSSGFPAAPREASPEKSEAIASREPLYASGLCEIPLNPPAKAGYVFYSDEIMHGLGQGNVYVTLGFEYLTDDPKADTAAKNTIYGAPGLFDEEQLPAVSAETAVKVMNERGSFIAAALLTQNTREVLLVLRWVAIKLPTAADPLESAHTGRSLAAIQPTAVLAAHESRYFGVNFRNMKPCTITYALMEKGAGIITSDGIYTAPAKEGVYEIKIACADEPAIFTFAYAVVKKKDAGEELPAE